MSGHEKHRQRLDEKIRKNGLDSLAEHEKLEYILFAVIPRGDTNSIAHNLLDKFVTISGVLRADFNDLITVEGVGKRTAMFLSTLPEILGAVERNIERDTRPILNSFEEVCDFAKTYFYGRMIEAAYLFCMDSSGRLICIDRISEGTYDETHVYTDRVLRQAIQNKAKTLIIAHNHPSGNVNPSVADIMLSRGIKKVCHHVGIEFGDSIVVAGKRMFSIHRSGYLDYDDVEELKQKLAEDAKKFENGEISDV